MLFAFSSICPLLQGQIDFYLDPIVVIATYLRCGLLSDMRETFIINQNEIAVLPVESVSELIQYAGGVDLQQRGTGGIQTDFGIRGSSFEQVLILIDGVRLNDPQTGHHNGDIPLSISDVERIEILAGHGSSLYGPDGFGGVVNIITKRMSGNQSNISVMSGSYGTIGGILSQTFRIGSIVNRLSFEKKKSDGYRWDTEYDITTISASSRLSMRNREIDWFFGHTSKDFGANGFYGDYPSKEKTEQTVGRVGMIWQPKPFLSLQSKIFGRYHTDQFVLDYQRPAWYQNRHYTVSWGGDVRANIRFSQEKEMAFGWEYVEERLTSSRLGNHRRFRIGLFGEWVYPLSSRFIINGGVRADHQKEWGLELNPTVSIKYFLSSHIQWRSSVGRVFRAPSFTELYYHSPADIGNPSLKPEYGWSIETGFCWGDRERCVETTFFWRDERNEIEWITWKMGDPWEAVNIGQIHISGISVSLDWTFGKWLSMQCRYTGMKRENENKMDYFAKYAYRVLKHHFVTTGFVQLPWRMKQSLVLNLKQRYGFPFYLLLDSKCTFQWKQFTFFLQWTNILDTKYEEIPDVPMAGRCMMVGSSFILE